MSELRKVSVSSDIFIWNPQTMAARDVRSLDDQALFALCDAAMSESDQHELSELFAEQREGALSPKAVSRLESLLQTYRRGLVVKAMAIREAVARGLRPRLDQTGA